ncbi:protein shisa-5-like [Chiloscyllium plagiosum]|uniref:protein shisa-5-like n=1 Tax=Chiloscyllium plagiosum TaxID=36176 RepID=UPI001CB7B0DC|nr:protein shisa-5-like [Chiloscyllium plagiosum]
MEKLGLHIACLVMVYVTVLPSVAAIDIECSLGFTGVSCRENNTTQKILIGVGVALSILVVVGVMTCCCCGCCACCRSEPPRSTVVTTVACSQQMAAYPQVQGYRPLPLQYHPGQSAVPTVPYSNNHPVAYPNYGQPPAYQEVSTMSQPQTYPATQSFHVPIPGDNPSFMDPVEPHK